MSDQVTERTEDDVQSDVNVILETLLLADAAGITVLFAFDAVKRLRKDAVRAVS